MYQTYNNQGFSIITVLVPEHGPVNTNSCRQWIDAYGITFPVLADSNKEIYHMYARSLPTNIVIDREMVIQMKLVGWPGFNNTVKNQILSKIEELIGQ